MLSDGCRLSVPVAAAPRMWSVGWVGYVSAIQETTGSGNRSLWGEVIPGSYTYLMNQAVQKTACAYTSLFCSTQPLYLVLKIFLISSQSLSLTTTHTRTEISSSRSLNMYSFKFVTWSLAFLSCFVNFWSLCLLPCFLSICIVIEFHVGPVHLLVPLFQ